MTNTILTQTYLSTGPCMDSKFSVNVSVLLIIHRYPYLDLVTHTLTMWKCYVISYL